MSLQKSFNIAVVYKDDIRDISVLRKTNFLTRRPMRELAHIECLHLLPYIVCRFIDLHMSKSANTILSIIVEIISTGFRFKLLLDYLGLYSSIRQYLVHLQTHMSIRKKDEELIIKLKETLKWRDTNWLYMLVFLLSTCEDILSGYSSHFGYCNCFNQIAYFYLLGGVMGAKIVSLLACVLCFTVISKQYLKEKVNLQISFFSSCYRYAATSVVSSAISAYYVLFNFLFNNIEFKIKHKMAYWHIYNFVFLSLVLTIIVKFISNIIPEFRIMNLDTLIPEISILIIIVFLSEVRHFISDCFLCFSIKRKVWFEDRLLRNKKEKQNKPLDVNKFDFYELSSLMFQIYVFLCLVRYSVVFMLDILMITTNIYICGIFHPASSFILQTLLISPDNKLMIIFQYIVQYIFILANTLLVLIYLGNSIKNAKINSKNVLFIPFIDIEKQINTGIFLYMDDNILLLLFDIFIYERNFLFVLCQTSYIYIHLNGYYFFIRYLNSIQLICIERLKYNTDKMLSSSDNVAKIVFSNISIKPEVSNENNIVDKVYIANKESETLKVNKMPFITLIRKDNDNMETSYFNPENKPLSNDECKNLIVDISLEEHFSKEEFIKYNNLCIRNDNFRIRTLFILLSLLLNFLLYLLPCLVNYFRKVMSVKNTQSYNSNSYMNLEFFALSFILTLFCYLNRRLF